MDLAVFSEENAETTTTAIMVLCSSHEAKRRTLGGAIYGLTGAELDKAVADYAGEKRKATLAAVVTFRAELTKELLLQKRSPPALNSGVSY